jgi:hypothetical protein
MGTASGWTFACPNGIKGWLIRSEDPPLFHGFDRCGGPSLFLDYWHWISAENGQGRGKEENVAGIKGGRVKSVCKRQKRRDQGLRLSR